MSQDTQLEIRQIRDQIIWLEGHPPVMLARDLAEIYQVTPKQIAEAVRRNPDRFPEDFVLRLTIEEWEKCSPHFEGSVSIKAFGEHNAPLAFTRNGANMLSACLKSKVAADRAIQIMRAFSAIEERVQQVPASGDLLLDSIRAMAQLREQQVETQKSLAAQSQTLNTHDQALADQGKKIKALATSHDEELRITPEQRQTINRVIDRLANARSAARKISIGEAYAGVRNGLRQRLGYDSISGISRAQYPMALDLLQVQLAREEAAAGQARLKLVKTKVLKSKEPWSDL